MFIIKYFLIYAMAENGSVVRKDASDRGMQIHAGTVDSHVTEKAISRQTGHAQDGEVGQHAHGEIRE